MDGVNGDGPAGDSELTVERVVGDVSARLQGLIDGGLLSTLTTRLTPPELIDLLAEAALATYLASTITGIVGQVVAAVVASAADA